MTLAGDSFYVQIPVRTWQNGLAYAIVDPIDSHLRTYAWSLTHPDRPVGYVRRSTSVWVEGSRKKSRSVYLHRQIAGLEEGDPRQVHHANHVLLDNRRMNLWVMSKDLNGRLKEGRSLLDEFIANPSLYTDSQVLPVGDPRRALAHLINLQSEPVTKYAEFIQSILKGSI